MEDCFAAEEIAGDVVIVRQRDDETAGRCMRVRRARRAIGENNWVIVGGVRCAGQMYFQYLNGAAACGHPASRHVKSGPEAITGTIWSGEP